MLLILLSLIWGSTYILIKQGLTAFNALDVGLLRTFFSGFFFIPLYFWLRPALRHLSLNDWKCLALTGFFGSVFPTLLFAVGQQVVPSALVGMLNTLQPVFVLVIAFFAFNQRFSRSELLGTGLGCIGATVLVLSSADLTNITHHLFYCGVVLLGMISYGIASNLIRHRLKHISAVRLTAISISIWSIPAFIGIVLRYSLGQVSTSSHTVAALLAIAVLALLGTCVAISLYSRLIIRYGLIFAVSITYFIPIVAIMWGVLDGEAIFFLHFIGLVLVLGALYLINYRRQSTNELVTQNQMKEV
ncbi:DMT family transporter [Zooshikella marina]|uniref:DMT family transporter n=1 Tax=Zooshikella ganghwensis TaxID=202772 RepID=UPI001BAF27E8|nr:DMT family transporter [Zooshikella ganghwensis]MBU2705366.1 DMT family transporter [Zooshikella ganghwensis]